MAQCFGADRHEGLPYLVGYVPGKTLAELAGQQRLGLNRALGLVGHVAEGLGAIHACGLLHRDLKPSNIVDRDRGAGGL